jgi:phosphoribosylformylglycinamidine cyclo-ligase
MSSKRIAILGNGSRENVIKEKLYPHEVYICETKEEILKLKNLDLVIPSMEKDLVNGIVDELNVPTFGPSKEAAEIEGSKCFSKNFMVDNDIPTSDFEIFTSMDESRNFLMSNFVKKKYVIKLDGLAGGKGVYVPDNTGEALDVLELIKGEKFIIEERIYGTEVSVMGFCNGHDIELMPQIMDYKRILDNDQGDNTGGMGSIGPVDILSEEELKSIKYDMLKVVRKLNFKGVLYAGIIKDSNGYYFLEFNCRFGDPETQVALNLLDSDLYNILMNCVHGAEMNIKWKNKFCANVVLSHVDYPKNKLKEAVEVKVNIKNFDKEIKVYWSNLTQGKTKGGRVASIVHVSNDLYQSLNIIYNNIHKINYQGIYYRKDIGYKYLMRKMDKKIKLNVAILTSSRGTSLRKLFNEGLIKLIITNKNTTIINKGVENSIDTMYIPRINYHQLINIIDDHDIDIIYTVGFMNIIPKHFCDYYKGRLFNIHPSLLPNYSKMFSLDIHKRVIENKELYSGCTLHEISENVDEGKIVLQKQILVDTSHPQTLKSSIQKLETDVLYDFLKIYQQLPINYKDSGVDVEKGDEFVKEIKNEHIGSFCSINKIPLPSFKDKEVLIASSTDGVGTKLELARERNNYKGLGIDLAAMCVNDLIARGAKPLIFLDYIAMSKLDNKVLLEIITGIKFGCFICGAKLVGGETAEMPGVYKSRGFDLAGFSVGTIENDIYPKIDKIKKGYKIYGLKSNGVHSNGFSLIRKLLRRKEYDTDILLKPTKIYTKCFEYIDKYKDNLLAMAHITGGGLTGNIKRVIKEGLKVEINVEIKDEFLWIMETGKLSYEDMISTFNCGFGMALIFDIDIEDEHLFEIGYIN